MNMHVQTNTFSRPYSKYYEKIRYNKAAASFDFDIIIHFDILFKLVINMYNFSHWFITDKFILVITLGQLLKKYQS